MESTRNIFQEIMEMEAEWLAHEKTEIDERIIKKKSSGVQKEVKETPGKKGLYTRRIPDVSKIPQFLKKDSVHGLAGSHNLGNTCFMNSSIQCLSNSTELTEFFLSGDYKKEINTKNPLGLGGKLANSWYELLYELWVKNDRVVDARDFKAAMAKREHKYAGYSQHDSHELITYFLDTLNEDLNRVTKKPYEEIKEKMEGESDEQASKRWWDLHLRRNDSIITDLFSGQFKSTIQCPECKWISVTFDPFNSISVPVPEEAKRYKRRFYYIPKYSMNKTTKIKIEYFSDSMFCDIIKLLQSSDNFKFDVEKLRVFSITDSKISKFFKPNDKIVDYEDNDFIFCSDMDHDDKYDENKNFIIPLYLASDFDNEDTVSTYPRLVTVNDEMTIEDFLKKIYLFARKFIDYGETDKFKEMYEKLIQNEKESKIMPEIEKLCDGEFNSIFYETSTAESDVLRKDLPFLFFLKNGNQRKYIIYNKEMQRKDAEFLDDYLSAKNRNSKMTPILNLFKQGWELCLEIQFTSKFYTKNLCKSFNTCIGMEDIDNNKSKGTDIYSCFDLFTETEQLDQENEWYCSHCKKHQKAYKRLELFYLPKLLIVHLKRFTNSSHRYYSSYWNKNDNYVDFPIENLNLKNYVTGPDKNNSVYDLYAVSQHYGSTGGGHYTACALNGGRWYSFNDSSVSSTGERDIKSSAAYVLFYRRKTD